MPKMCTFAIGAIIQRAVRNMAATECYVNVGVWTGYSLIAGLLGNNDQRVIGVDNFSQFGGPKEEAFNKFNSFKCSNHHLVEMDYRDYFASTHQGDIGVYFYDGDHDYDNQINGLAAAEPFFSPNCLILVDDTNMFDPRQATFDFLEQSKHSYEILMDQPTAGNYHPTFWNGLMVIQRTK